MYDSEKMRHLRDFCCDFCCFQLSLLISRWEIWSDVNVKFLMKRKSVLVFCRRKSWIKRDENGRGSSPVECSVPNLLQSTSGVFNDSCTKEIGPVKAPLQTDDVILGGNPRADSSSNFLLLPWRFIKPTLPSARPIANGTQSVGRGGHQSGCCTYSLH